MRIARKIRSAARLYQTHGLGSVARFARARFAAIRETRALALANPVVRASRLSDVLNFRAEFSHLPVGIEDVEQCRGEILYPFVRRQFEFCAEVCASELGRLTPIELCIYADCLYRIQDYATLAGLADLLRQRLEGTKFFVRADHLARRGMLRTGQLSKAAEGLDGPIRAGDIGLSILRGDIWDAVGRLQDATQAYERAISMQSDNPMTRLHYGFHLLKKGETLAGLTSWGIADRFFGTYPLRREWTLWRGENLNGLRLIVVFEHGLGDMIQFARFLPRVKQRWPDAVVIGQVPAPLVGLLAQSFPEMIFVPSAEEEEEDPAHDFYVPATQLPVVLEETSLEPTQGYIRLADPTPDLLHFGRRRLRVGVCWRGHPRQYELVRSIPLPIFARLFEAQDIDFIVLLNKVTPEEAALLQSLPNVSVPPIKDFIDLSALVAACDLVVSVDTAVVHVAAAAGQRLILVSRPDSCWRWGASDETSRWYPQVEIVRHPGDLNWDAVLAEVARRLDDAAASRAEPAESRSFSAA
jgi:hypothetical protein